MKTKTASRSAVIHRIYPDNDTTTPQREMHAEFLLGEVRAKERRIREIKRRLQQLEACLQDDVLEVY